jgi:2-oxo-3-hexenedioate decarboxylase
MNEDVADRLLAALDEGRQVEPMSLTDRTFDIAAANRVLDTLHRRRIAQGWRPLGRKIGFTNTTLWERYGVDRAMWSHVWDRTVVFATDGRATVSLQGLMEPRIEPELVVKLRATLPGGDDANVLLGAVEWIAAGFEIVQSVFPGWRFGAPDCTAALGLHARLVVGPPLRVDDANRATLAAAMPDFTVALLRDGELVDTGVGSNVLGAPTRALSHLRELLAQSTAFRPLAAGEIVTTGTLTDAFPVAPGQAWTARYGVLGVRGIDLAFR